MHPRTLKLILILIAISANIALVSGIIFTMGKPPQNYSLVDVKVDLNTRSIYLISNCSMLSFKVTPDQAYSIWSGLQKRIETRPLTHDLLQQLLEFFGVKLESVKIDQARDGVYLARMIFISNNTYLDLDSRPSDGIALAVRTGSPIYVSDQLLEQYGERIC